MLHVALMSPSEHNEAYRSDTVVTHQYGALVLSALTNFSCGFSAKFFCFLCAVSTTVISQA